MELITAIQRSDTPAKITKALTKPAHVRIARWIDKDLHLFDVLHEFRFAQSQRRRYRVCRVVLLEQLCDAVIEVADGYAVLCGHSVGGDTGVGGEEIVHRVENRNVERWSPEIWRKLSDCVVSEAP